MSSSLAEELKREVGNAVVTDVPQVGRGSKSTPDPRRLPLRSIAEILEARARELSKYVRDSLRDGGIENQWEPVCVLTGGVPCCPACSTSRRASLHVGPHRFAGAPSEYAADLVHPAFPSIVGMVLSLIAPARNGLRRSQFPREVFRAPLCKASF